MSSETADSTPGTAAPRTPGIPTLIKCSACGRDIASVADKCPGCGAPNAWIHPTIEHFRALKDQTGVSKKFQFWSNKTEIWGHTEAKLPWWTWILIVLFFPIGLAGFWTWFIFLPLLYLAIKFVYGKKKEFKANLLMGSWQSNDDKFWGPVRQILGV